MARTSEENQVLDDFAENYRLGVADVMRAVERSVCGCDYGSTSWTTRDEAAQIAELLDVSAGDRLLDIGAGAGWPGLYLSQLTGCTTVLVDLPLDGLRVAAARAAADRQTETCCMVSAAAEALPFPDSCFDAICHSDVLCCLRAKRAVLQSCRRCVGLTGRMVFTVVFMPPDLSDADRAGLEGAGPPFSWSDVPYDLLLAETGWHIEREIDLSAGYAASIARMVAALEDHADAVCAHLGAAVWKERLDTQRRSLAAAEAGFLRRHLFAVTASPDMSGAQP